MPVTVIHTPPRGPQLLIADAIKSARIAVRVMMQQISNPVLAAELITAHRRGASVSVVLDSDGARLPNSLAAALHDAGVPIAVDSYHDNMTLNCVIIDGRLLFCGSYNWTLAAEHADASTLVQIDDPVAVAQAAMQFGTHLAHSGAWVA